MVCAFTYPTPLFRASSGAWKAPRSSQTLTRRVVAASHGQRFVKNGNTNGNGDPASNIAAYNAWVEKMDPSQVEQTSSAFHAKISAAPKNVTPHPPPFAPLTLFHAGAEEYAADMTTPPSPDFARIAERTADGGLFAPCMVGAIEGQFLKMVAQIKAAKRVLDVGTFTGYSALAFADAIATNVNNGPGAKVVTIEADGPTAQVARECFKAAKNGGLIELVEDEAKTAMMDLRDAGEKFDIVFLDADKVNYSTYYELGLEMLEQDGLLMADNALCSLVYNEDDPAKQALHDFVQLVRADARVEQVMLTVREGILLVRKV